MKASICNQPLETHPQGEAQNLNSETLSLHIPVELKARYVPPFSSMTPEFQKPTYNVSI